MAVTYGFYNSINKDRMYNAIQMSQIFDGIINDGVYMSVLNHFAVRAASGMNVIVGGGRAWFNHTWTYNDSDMILNIDESEFEAGRIDAITIKIDRRDSGRVNTVEVVKGTPSEHPVKPILENGNDIYYHPLAYVTVNAGVTEITDSNIENAIGVDTRTPYVTGIIETISTADLITQWQAEWTEWNDEHRQAYLDWVAAQEADMEDWEADTKGDYEEWISEQKDIYDAWYADRQAQFMEWFNEMKGQLSEDAAGHLQNEIDDLSSEVHNTINVQVADIYERMFRNLHDVCNASTVYERDNSGDINRITSTNSDDSVTDVIVYNRNGNVLTITETVSNATDRYICTTTYNGTTSTQVYTKEAIE